MGHLVTLDRKSPLFEPYLMNTFSKTERAIPVESLLINTESEVVTFEIKKESECKRKSRFSRWWPFVKLSKLLYVLFPIFYVVSDISIQGYKFDSMTLLLTILSVVMLYLAVNFITELIDHKIGIDRLQTPDGPRPIALGWVKGIEALRAAFVCFGCSILFGVPVVLAFPNVLICTILASVLIYISVLREKKNYRDYFVGDILWCLLLGPILSCGTELSIRGQWQWKVLCFGLIWSLLLFARLQLSHFESLAIRSIAKIKNPMTWFGFDKGRLVLGQIWIAFLGVFIIFHIFNEHWLIWISSFLIISFFSYKQKKYETGLNSPLGNQIKIFSKKGHELFVLVVAVWSLQLIFQIFISQFITRLGW